MAIRLICDFQLNSINEIKKLTKILLIWADLLNLIINLDYLKSIFLKNKSNLSYVLCLPNKLLRSLRKYIMMMFENSNLHQHYLGKFIFCYLTKFRGVWQLAVSG